MKQPDSVIAKTLSAHLKFIQKLDESYKLATKATNAACSKVYKTFEKIGFDTKFVENMFENVYSDDLARTRVAQDFNELKKLPGFEDVKMSHYKDSEQW